MNKTKEDILAEYWWGDEGTEKVILSALEEWGNLLAEKAFNAAKCGIRIKKTLQDGKFSVNDISPVETYADYINHPEYKIYISQSHD